MEILIWLTEENLILSTFEVKIGFFSDVDVANTVALITSFKTSDEIANGFSNTTKSIFG